MSRKFILAFWLFAALCFLGIDPKPAQAAISFVGGVTKLASDNTDQPLTPPGTQVGDFIIVFLAHNSAVVTDGADGWTFIRGGPSNPDVMHIGYRFADTGGAQQVGWSLSTVGNYRYVVGVFRGVDAASPIATFANGPAVADTFTSFPTVTTPAPGCWVLRSDYAQNTTADDASITFSCSVAFVGGWFTAGNRLLVSYETQASPGPLSSTLGS